jgi:hypothetical protein
MHQSNNKYSLVWQKWVDPFGGDDIFDDNLRPDDIGEFDDDLGMMPMRDEEEDDEERDHFVPIHKATRAIMTPLGLIPYNEHTASGKLFNFWTGHTNFNVSPPIVGIIQSADGVEALDVFTRYRFRIAIGQLFDAAGVMSSITTQVYDFLERKKD